MTPLIIKKQNNQNIIAQMYQADSNADEDIAKDFSEIIDKIIIDVYLKENIFMNDKILLKLSQKEKIDFVKRKRQEIIEKIQESPFEQEEYIVSNDTSFKMTSCVKCCCLGIYEDEYYEWIKENPNGIYCDVCQHRQDDFKKMQ